MSGIKLSVHRLQKGLYIRLPVSWRSHPFLFNSFKIKDDGQIALIKQLGISHVIVMPDKSDAAPLKADADIVPVTAEDKQALEELQDQKEQRIEALQDYRRDMQKCEKAFERSVAQVRSVMSKVTSRPLNAISEAKELVEGMVDTLLNQDEMVLHLMNETKEGENLYYHSLNVSVLSMLLGKSKGLSKDEITWLGMAGLFHDIGKMKIPTQILNKTGPLNTAEKNFLQLHPKYSIELLAHGEDFPEQATTIISQHHEYADGSGYPKGLTAEKLSPLSLLLALVNEYDSLCHPNDIKKARTPYSALSYIFKSCKSKFAAEDIELMVKHLGVFPPGTVVQLSNNQVGLVISVNQTKLLYPNVLLYDPGIPRTEATIVNLEEVDFSIAKALPPRRLKPEVYEYLNPRTRISYYFDNKEK
ncbi:HD-GYP domain-containing protein [Corallincola platygyrae]|uniref:HD-GYP domain-containing protein n=1 Tax=Corallincola platygyrae TaxID=1193278 RepID=A0ABW4XI38_9GAMM